MGKGRGSGTQSNRDSQRQHKEGQKVNARRRKYFTITVCLVVSDATEGPHEGRCAVGRSDTGPGHPDASVAVTRAYSLGEGGREAQQGQRHAVLKQTVALDNSFCLSVERMDKWGNSWR